MEINHKNICIRSLRFYSANDNWILEKIYLLKDLQPFGRTWAYREMWMSFCRKRTFWRTALEYTIRAPVFGRHQFFGTSEHYGKAHWSLLSGWMNYNYTACCWFPTSSNILTLPSQIWQIRLKVADCTVQSAEYWCIYGTCAV